MHKLLKTVIVLVLLAGFSLSMLRPDTSVIVPSSKNGSTLTCLLSGEIVQSARIPRFKALVLAEPGGHHIPYTSAAKPWLDQLAADSNFSIEYIQNTDLINEGFLKDFQLFIQLDYPPYAWKPAAVKAFEAYIQSGKGGWIGFHHATLLGEFDGFPMWQWFSDFMGGIRFKDYIADFAKGKVVVEDAAHPVMKGIKNAFWIEKEEWYTYNKSPRPNVHVIASVDENSYSPATNKKMGDHPVIWSNPRMPGKNIYIFMGHSPDLFRNPDYITLFRNAISWASQP
ncbi:ThuA domain-containing protein [Chitinophaga sp. YIM B06452]|uniref:ThuA domain-containing protein n=1 Tax=Chitinophaga sp. YIM B06452 TaxID=3082158 RepID=UPI0031FE6C87